MSSSAEATGLAATRMVAAALRDVTVRYGGVTAVDSLDLDIEAGRITVLLGPNGAGKTSTIRVLLGLASPAAGSVRVFGHDPRTRAARQRTGAMMQIAKVPEMLRVVEHIETFRSYYETPLSTAELIEAVGLGGLERRLFGRLSGGERQRLLFALALAGDPALLFLDEPTVGMDVTARRAFWSRVRTLAAAGRAVLLTTHYLEEADALADRVVVLDQGRVVADGPPSAIKRDFARKRVSFVSRAGVRWETLPGVIDTGVAGDRIDLLSSAPEETVKAAFLLDPGLTDLEVSGAALEDAFVALTGGGLSEVPA